MAEGDSKEGAEENGEVEMTEEAGLSFLTSGSPLGQGAVLEIETGRSKRVMIETANATSSPVSVMVILEKSERNEMIASDESSYFIALTPGILLVAYQLLLLRARLRLHHFINPMWIATLRMLETIETLFQNIGPEPKDPILIYACQILTRKEETHGLGVQEMIDVIIGQHLLRRKLLLSPLSAQYRSEQSQSIKLLRPSRSRLAISPLL